MLQFTADENFNNDIVRGLLRYRPDLDIVRIQDVGLSGADDPTVFEWAAQENRVLLTHDVTTITKYAYERVSVGKRMPGVFEIGLLDVRRLRELGWRARIGLREGIAATYAWFLAQQDGGLRR